jgi:hypothetical protein
MGSYRDEYIGIDRDRHPLTNVMQPRLLVPSLNFESLTETIMSRVQHYRGHMFMLQGLFKLTTMLLTMLEAGQETR